MASDERDPGDSETTTAPAAPPPMGVDRGDRVHAFRAPAITVTWSRRRCTHAADCVMNLPTVFEPGRRPWVDVTQGSPDAVARVVTRCPTGALHFERQDGGAAEPIPAANTVLVTRNGPTYVRGDLELVDEAGETRLRDTRLALCRCGLSKNKPLCDNAHIDAGFRESGAITAADAEARVEDPGAEGTRLRIVARPNGPLELLGPFAITGADRKTMLAGTKTKLCRCGHSSSKPFCDGTHKRVGFKGD